MIRVRTYGSAPRKVAVVHGGPGAAGEMAPVAERLSGVAGIVEPLQTETTVDGQGVELAEALRTYGAVPVTLIGYSWGAWLSLIVAARYPSYVRKVVCVGSGVFEEACAADLMTTRLGRLAPEEREEAESLVLTLGVPSAGDRDAMLARFGRLMAKADTYCPLSRDARARRDGDAALCRVDEEIHRKVWAEAHALRKNGRLLEICRDVQCPVVAVHGDYDPGPVEGVRAPLSRTLRDFRFILLEKCGHCPWVEEEACNLFFDILIREIA
ncbi:alpha/beta fold hydrolase [Methanofollis ethanolicus]|uniref:alpha/beta fold hydrolase n=1 Tax=Methanofollis ethanolicus TaxID=488124 RepID=UPI000830AAAE|nr:alpha/beta hydrolase [Methanofollis ethanolicus]